MGHGLSGEPGADNAPQSILMGDWRKELEAEAQRRAETERRAKHYDALVGALEALLTATKWSGSSDDTTLENAEEQARAALDAAKKEALRDGN